ncbi:MAG: pilus assembly protein TadG-related protein [Magnetospirillum sp.]|nr:pilus assembly protein TadG-related protein [Magnetospirillum sp.]
MRHLIPPPPHGSLLRDRRGVVALYFAVVLGFIALLLVAALDLIRVHLIRSRMWSAVDSAILAAGRSLGTGDWQQVGVDYFNANMGKSLGETVTITKDSFQTVGNPLVGQQVSLSVKASIPVLSHALGNIAAMEVEVGATALRKSLTVDLAMVLDNTGSMLTNDNIGALRIDALELLHILSGGATAGNLANSRIALVPYSAAVNPGSEAKDLTDGSAAYDPANPLGWKGCVIERHGANAMGDTPASAEKWRPYVWDDKYTDNEYTKGKLSTVFADWSWKNDSTGPNVGCPTPITPLTTDITALTTDINAMRAWSRGGTLSDIGMAWGLRVLSPDPPFTQGAAWNDPNIGKAVVLMTDGETNFHKLTDRNLKHNEPDSRVNSDYTGYGRLDEYGLVGATTVSAGIEKINENLKALCTAMKSPPYNIQVYTITFGSNINEKTKTIYRTCASGSANYFHAPDQPTLRNAFQSIGGALSELTLVK